MKNIEELIQQASFENYISGPYSETSFDEYKFAKLIIQECIKSGDGLINHYINTHNEQEQAFLIAAINDYQTLIKKHFGIKDE